MTQAATLNKRIEFGEVIKYYFLNQLKSLEITGKPQNESDEVMLTIFFDRDIDC